MSYVFAHEDGQADYPEFEHLYRQHYAEMCERLKGEGIDFPPYAPRLDAYFHAQSIGYLHHFTVRTDAGEPVGYANIYVMRSMHNGEMIAREDTIFITRKHRNGVGVRFMRFLLADLKARGVRHATVMAVTTPRVVKLWQRMGFRPVGMSMIYTF